MKKILLVSAIIIATVTNVYVDASQNNFSQLNKQWSRIGDGTQSKASKNNKQSGNAPSKNKFDFENSLDEIDLDYNKENISNNSYENQETDENELSDIKLEDELENESTDNKFGSTTDNNITNNKISFNQNRHTEKPSNSNSINEDEVNDVSLDNLSMNSINDQNNSTQINSMKINEKQNNIPNFFNQSKVAMSNNKNKNPYVQYPGNKNQRGINRDDSQFNINDENEFINLLKSIETSDDTVLLDKDKKDDVDGGNFLNKQISKSSIEKNKSRKKSFIDNGNEDNFNNDDFSISKGNNKNIKSNNFDKDDDDLLYENNIELEEDFDGDNLFNENIEKKFSSNNRLEDDAFNKNISKDFSGKNRLEDDFNEDDSFKKSINKKSFEKSGQRNDLGRNDFLNKNSIHTQLSIDNEQKDKKNQIIRGLSKTDENIIEELFPNELKGSFKNETDCNRWGRNSLKVTFLLTKEICNAIFNRNSDALARIILNNISDPNGTNTFIKCINQMINNFNQVEELNDISSYLNITDGKSTYTEVSGMKNWLISLKNYKEIEEVAKSFFEKADDSSKIDQSHNLLVDFYFNGDGTSEIDLPKLDSLPLLTMLKKKENEINNLIRNKNEELRNYGDVLEAANLRDEINKLESNDKIKKLKEIKTKIEDIEKNIPDIQNNINDAKNKKIEAEKQAKNTTNKSNTKAPTSNMSSGKRQKIDLSKKSSQTPTNSSSSHVSNKTIQDLNKKINELNSSLNDANKNKTTLEAEKKTLEKECKEITDQIAEKENKLKELGTFNDETLNEINSIKNEFNRKVKNILTQVQKMFNGEYKNISSIGIFQSQLSNSQMSINANRSQNNNQNTLLNPNANDGSNINLQNIIPSNNPQNSIQQTIDSNKPSSTAPVQNTNVTNQNSTQNTLQQQTSNMTTSQTNNKSSNVAQQSINSTKNSIKSVNPEVKTNLSGIEPIKDSAISAPSGKTNVNSENKKKEQEV